MSPTVSLDEAISDIVVFVYCFDKITSNFIVCATVCSD